MRLFALILVASIMAFHTPAKALSVSDALGTLGGGIFSRIDKSVDNIFGNIDSTVVGMRANVEGLIASGRSNMVDFLDKSVEELEGQERALWLYYKNALTEVDQRVETHLRTARITILDASNTITHEVPFTSNAPAVHWVEVEPPLYDRQAKERRVTAFGLNLDRPGNMLKANGAEGRKASASPTQLIFAIDAVDVSGGLKLDYELEGKRSVVNVLGAWTDRTYPTKTFEVPAQVDLMGDIQLIYHKDVYDEISRKWPANRDWYSVNCQRGGTFGTSGCGARYGPTYIAASQGYSVLPDTITYQENTHGCRRNSVRVGASEASGNGFKVSGYAYPNSGAYRRCYLNSRFTWRERKNVARKVDTLTDAQEMRRSLNGVTFRYPAQGATPVGFRVLAPGADEAQDYDLASIRAKLTVKAQPGTGIVEVIWRGGN
ncbi:MAG: hypothetical protein AAGH82_01090 [Pseudomonadota bacterium]